MVLNHKKMNKQDELLLKGDTLSVIFSPSSFFVSHLRSLFASVLIGTIECGSYYFVC